MEFLCGFSVLIQRLQWSDLGLRDFELGGPSNDRAGDSNVCRFQGLEDLTALGDTVGRFSFTEGVKGHDILCWMLSSGPK